MSDRRESRSGGLNVGRFRAILRSLNVTFNFGSLLSSSRVFLAVLATTSVGTAACESASVPDAPIAAVHRVQCARCHAAPEPKTRSRRQLEDAFARHKGRAHLSDQEWGELVQYLARPDGPTARND